MGRPGVSFVAALAVIAAACTGGGTSASSPSSTPSPNAPAPHPGGEATIGVEGWPLCLNPIIGCGDPWAFRTVLYHVLPRAMAFGPDGSWDASPLLVEAPTFENGGLTQAPFTVQYRISEGAVWDDGSPISSEDIAFTWRAILHTRLSELAHGYRPILAVDTPDPKTALLRFDEPSANWPEFFGGTEGFILKESAFPKANSRRPDLRWNLGFDVPFSGGPFRLLEWKPTRFTGRGQIGGRAILERNERYFGATSLLDRVTFVPRFGPDIEFRSLAEKSVDLVAPNSGGAVFCCQPLPVVPTGVDLRAGNSPYFEALWFNAHERPLNNPLVREALMFALDRQEVVDEVVEPFNAGAKVLNCGFLALPGGPWCRIQPFERFTYDPARALSLLAQSGYDCTKTPCEKNGKQLEVRYFTDGLGVFRAHAQQVLINQALAAGFFLKVVNIEAGVLFGSDCPFFRIAIIGCALPVPANASVTQRFSCDAIPSRAKANFSDHLNLLASCNKEADRVMKESDRELDPIKRLDLLDRIYELEAQDMMGIPLFVIPTFVAWRNDRLAGPIDLYLSSPYGPFFNMNEWYIAQ